MTNTIFKNPISFQVGSIDQTAITNTAAVLNGGNGFSGPNIFAGTLTSVDFRYDPNPVVGYVFTCTDGTTGSAAWQIPNVTLTATQTFSGVNTFSGNAVFSSGVQISTGATSGYVLTSDSSGNATWQAGSGGGGVSLSGTNAWTGTNSYNTNLPTSTLTPSSGTQLITKTYADATYATSAGTVTLAGTNAWTGTNTYNSALPTSTLTPSSGTQLITKTFADTTYAALAGTQTFTGINTFSQYPVMMFSTIVTGNNVFYGYQGPSAPIRTATGTNNCYFGQGAMNGLTAGGDNVAIGNDTATGLTTGSRNTTAGAAAGLTLGAQNDVSSFGYLAGGGTQSSALGSEALRVTTGTNCTAAGFQAGKTNTSGASNVFVGKSSGNNTTASNQTCIGTLSVAGNFAQSTALGYAATATAANQIMLGTSTEKVVFPGTAPLQITTGATSGYVLTSDASGNGTWQAGGGGGSGPTLAADQTWTGINTFLQTPVMMFSTIVGNNTYYGYQGPTAPIRSATGTNNSYYGAYALEELSTGSSNVAIGYAAGLFITTGSRNTAVGNNAGLNARTNNDNTSLGYSALGAIVSQGSAVGSGALQATTGSSCSALGYQAGTSNTSGANNVFVGASSGNGTTASNQTCVGSLAVAGNFANSTALGYSATATAANQIMLGTSAETVVHPGTGASGSASFASGTFYNQAVASVSGSTSGNITWTQPQQGVSWKKVAIYCNALLGTASFTFTTAFTNTPQIMATNGPASSVVTALSTTAVTITGATTSGFIFLEGY